MKTIKSIKYILVFFVSVFLAACDRDKFAEMNTDPDAILSIPPEYEFTSGLLAIHRNSFEYYYDYNRGMHYWAQSYVPVNGNAATVFDGSGNMNNRPGTFYGSVGNKLVDVQQIIDKLPEEKKAQYVHLRAIAGIPLAYYAWYTSDVNGSIVYSEGFKARYATPALFTPKYDTQEELYNILDAELKAIVAILKTTQPVGQIALANNDVYFKGDVTKWIKAANSLRLRMAFRLMKRNPAKLKAIATEVLANDAEVINAIADDWKLIGGTAYFNDGNYNPSSNGDMSSAKNLVDFMWNTKDPRTRVFYTPSFFNKRRFDAAKEQGKLPAEMVWDGQLYRGQFVDPDASASTNPVTRAYYTAITVKLGGADSTGRLPSMIQNRLFLSTYNNGTGNTTFPVITYADMCFMRAELAVRGILGTDAEGWYYKGIDASLANYDEMANKSKLADYVALTPAEVTTYKAQPGIKYDAANALEQIIVQQYINYYKNQNEAWAIIKRTGLPSTTGKILKLETVRQGGTVQVMPRRFAIGVPSITDINYENNKAALDAQQKDPSFGIPSDIKGRVWWDMP
ncbi:SusD/RagB family nutrient-binding outer membrane lipoprotein [Dyadobacter psychrotolerans]|uniref:SusD/RagB family nutrient-binding outer membrane lipoprotein n=1 Tax=Dyadobacter psychrotolerans TaxID=2541721 RepID=A0A4R5DNP6_9BACT|nr:SusD/RagB family nutrient-binding outer membrane lipoprotein [Dyadobacter psychrotolerans]TDE13621.1 SusD/RagB family nutrient-binding outer membrane lipoprotein [Dyadobacter psychrotolerans]